jgi:Na+/H+ antiporter NhaD/arsenite permease-like protein
MFDKMLFAFFAFQLLLAYIYLRLPLGWKQYVWFHTRCWRESPASVIAAYLWMSLLLWFLALFLPTVGYCALMMAVVLYCISELTDQEARLQKKD